MYDLLIKCSLVNDEWGEEALCKKIQRATTWFGRYHVPTKAEDLKDYFELKYGEHKEFYRSYSSGDIKKIDEILKRAFFAAKCTIEKSD